MADETKRRPLPALICLLALTLLAALVWWRVLHRSPEHATASSPCPTQPAPTVLPQPAAVSVSVLNSTQRAGIAKATATLLTKRGFKVTGYGNDIGHPLVAGTAQIRFAATQKDAATLVSFYFPGSTLLADSTITDGTVIVSLGQQFSAVAASATVQAEITAAHLSQAPSTAPPSPGAPSPSPSC